MYRETKLEDEKAAAQFRDSVFLHSVAGHIPGFYNKVFDDEPTGEVTTEPTQEGINWLIPESPEEFASWMDELRELDVNVSFDPGRLGIHQS